MLLENFGEKSFEFRLGVWYEVNHTILDEFLLGYLTVSQNEVRQARKELWINADLIRGANDFVDHLTHISTWGLDEVDQNATRLDEMLERLRNAEPVTPGAAREMGVVIDKLKLRKLVVLERMQALTKAMALTGTSSIDPGTRTEKSGKLLEEFTEALVQTRTHDLSATTLKMYRRTLSLLGKFAGNVPIDSISPQQGDEYKARRLEKIGAVSANIEIRTLRAAFNVALKWRLIKENPFDEVRQVRLQEHSPLFLSANDFKRLIDSIKEPWVADVVTFAAMTGARRGEIINLRWCNVNLSNEPCVVIESSPTFRTKAGKRRVLPLNKIAVEILRNRGPSSPDALVFTNRGRPITGGYLSHRFKKYVRDTGLDGRIHFHNLRSTFASTLTQQNVDPLKIKELLGHSDIKTTMEYTRPRTEHLHHEVDEVAKALFPAKSANAPDLTQDKDDNDAGGSWILLVPENLDLEKLLSNCGISETSKWIESYYWVVSEIYTQTIERASDRNGEPRSVPLHSKTLETILTSRRRGKIMDDLRKLGVIRRVGGYIPGKQSYGYKLSSEYSGADLREFRVTDESLIRRLRRIRIGKTVPEPLARHFQGVRIDRDSALLHIDKELELGNITKEQYRRFKLSVLKFASGDRWISRDDNVRRVHSNVANMPKQVRQFLLADSERLCEIDLSNSQVIFLLKILESLIITPYDLTDNKMSEHKEYARFKELVQRGHLYEYLQRGLPDIRGLKYDLEDREDVKMAFIKEFLCGKVPKKRRSKTLKGIEQLFPAVYRAVMDYKRRNGHAELARKLQREESSMIIDSICAKISQDRPTVFFATIHDCIMVKPSDVVLVRNVIAEEFQKKLGFVPRMKIKCHEDRVKIPPHMLREWQELALEVSFT